MGSLTDLMDPFAAAYQLYSGLNGGPLMSGYDFKVDPYKPGQNLPTTPTTPETPATPGDQTGTGGNGNGMDRDQHDGLNGTEREGPYGWEKDYWGGEFAPDYGWKDYAKEIAYGRALPGSMKLGNLMLGNPFASALKLLNPLNDPAVMTGMQQFSKANNINYDQLRQAVQTAYGQPGANKGMLSGLLAMFNTPSSKLNPVINATDTLRGVVGLTTPGWQDVFNNQNFSVMDQFKHFDPTATGFLTSGPLDPYQATQFMDAYGKSGQTPSAVNANFGFSPSVAGTGVLGFMVDPSIPATTKIGILQNLKEGKNPGVGFDPNGQANTAARSAATGLNTGLTGWLDGTVSTDELSDLFDAYMGTAGMTNDQLSKLDKYGGFLGNRGLTDQELADKYDGSGFGEGSGKDGSTKGDPGLGGNGIDKDNTSGTGCFVAGTPVRMLSGEEIPIEQVKVGDSVLSYDTDLGLFVGADVEELRRPKSKNLVRITFTDGSSITTTPDHPFYTGEGWAAVNPGTACKHVADPRSLGSGCEIFGEYGKRTVLGVASMGMPEEVPLYNFKIGGTHTYIAGGLVVHNK